MTIYVTNMFNLYVPIYLNNIHTFYMLMVSLLINSLFSLFEQLKLNKSTQSTFHLNFYPILELAQFFINTIYLFLLLFYVIGS